MAEGTGVEMAGDKAKMILGYLAQRKAVPLLELVSTVDIPEDQVQTIINNLEKENYIKVSDKGTLDEIVTIRDQGIRAAYYENKV